MKDCVAVSGLLISLLLLSPGVESDDYFFDSTTIQLNHSFYFFGQNYSQVMASWNGALTFNTDFDKADADGELTEPAPLIALFWVQHGTSHYGYASEYFKEYLYPDTYYSHDTKGAISVRTSSEKKDLKKIWRMIRQNFPKTCRRRSRPLAMTTITYHNMDYHHDICDVHGEEFCSCVDNSINYASLGYHMEFCECFYVDDYSYDYCACIHMWPESYCLCTYDEDFQDYDDDPLCQCYANTTDIWGCYYDYYGSRPYRAISQQRDPRSHTGTNTYSVHLIPTKHNSYILMEYGQINWIYDSNNRYGDKARVGFKSESESYYHDLSGPDGDPYQLTNSSNIGLAGSWLYQVHKATGVVGANCTAFG